jgi:hypothetical protein
MYTIFPRQLKRFSFQEDCLNLLRNVFEESAPGATTLLRPTQFPTLFYFYDIIEQNFGKSLT